MSRDDYMPPLRGPARRPKSRRPASGEPQVMNFELTIPLRWLRVLEQLAYRLPGAHPEDIARDILAQELDLRRCRVCGCTDMEACVEGCAWIEVDLCSVCEPVARGKKQFRAARARAAKGARP